MPTPFFAATAASLTAALLLLFSCAEPPTDSRAEQGLSQALAAYGTLAGLLSGEFADPSNPEQAYSQADTALNQLIASRSQWFEAEPEDRIRLRQNQLGRIDNAEVQLKEALELLDTQQAADPNLARLAQRIPQPSDFRREPPLEPYHGVFRRGFEASHFYAKEGDGAWWAVFQPDADHALEAIEPEGVGRGAFKSARISVEGWLSDAPETSAMGPFEKTLHVERITSVEPISQDAFQDFVAAQGN